MSSAILLAIITASAALIGAMVAQIIAHVFAVIRENRKSQMQVYQNF